MIIGDFMTYDYNSDTLLHSVGFNLQRLESILSNGILSYNKAKEKGIDFTKNYSLKETNDDYISLVRVGDIKEDDNLSAYNIHTTYGINLIVEDTSFEDDPFKFYLHRPDEVLVKDEIPLNNIKGLAILKDYQDNYLFNLPVIPYDITSYAYLVSIVDDYSKFLAKYNYVINKDELKEYIREIYLINKALFKLDIYNFVDREELIKDYQETLRELNEFLGEETYLCFSDLLGERATLKNTINYLSHNKFSIYDIPRHSLIK